jgi:putative phosphoesterase
MKIAILSDTHNNWPNFKKALEYIKKEKITMVLHCGDICNQEIMDKAKVFFDFGEIKFVGGNGDYNLGLPETLEFKFNSKNIAFAHIPDIAKKLAQSGKYDYVFYGHTHRAWDEIVKNTHFINPGELAGHFYKPTFAIYDTVSNQLELKILEKL